MLTSLGIDASQYLAGSPSALGILADRATEGGCPEGMSFINGGGNDFCIDTFEVSPDTACPHANPGHLSLTAENIDSGCYPQSQEDVMPWVHVTYHQALELCSKRGMRLPSHGEWYKAALGVTDSQCLVDESGVLETGSAPECVSGSGAYDMVGNVWEWVAAESRGGQYDDRVLPETGYVTGADLSGVASETGENPADTFHDDYFWSNGEGQYVMIRGGFYSSSDDAGLYSIHADIDPGFSSGAIGFRCVF